MGTSTPVYKAAIISPRSRRLRLIAGMLVTAIVAMAIYGMTVLMPGVRKAVLESSVQPAVASIHTTALGSTSASGESPLHVSAKNARMLRARVIVMYGYWSFWLILVLALLLDVWLDLREVSRNYLNQRRELWDTATRATQERTGKLPPQVDSGSGEARSKDSPPGSQGGT